ncbi:uncharacterized protein LOC132285934 [Cornus florida]|uniref:uncharacterized protein LOC132285934 n=1 Tax=Cornus florida TaxID=4283 RepID=UPI0028A056E9|nr:uncharacterized protein LOC132285934 [Cornus florida]
MAPKSKPKTHSQSTTDNKLASSAASISNNDDDDFQDALPLTVTAHTQTQTHISSSRQPLKPSNSMLIQCPPSSLSSKPKRPKTSTTNLNPAGKENLGSKGDCNFNDKLAVWSGLDSIESTIDFDCSRVSSTANARHVQEETDIDISTRERKGFKKSNYKSTYSSNSIESRLLTSILDCYPNAAASSSGNNGSSSMDEGNDSKSQEYFEPGTQLDVLLKLCAEADKQDDDDSSNGHLKGCASEHSSPPVHCPMCGIDISDLNHELRLLHTNECLDKEESTNVVLPNDDPGPHCPGQVFDGSPVQSPRKVVDVSPVLAWLRSLGLARYEEVFVREEIDWDTLQWLTDEDLFSIGVTALGPRKRIVHALNELRKEDTKTAETHSDASKVVANDNSKLAANKLITDFFPGSVADRRKDGASSRGQSEVVKRHSGSGRKQITEKKHVTNRKLRDIPSWCCIPGTPFRVDAFKYLRRDCSHWVLTHFHLDHYQGLTRSFCHGKIYCSLITAKLVNMKLGISWDKLQVLPLNQKISIAGIDVTCFDANHCPGSVIMLFEPPNGEAVLHTGDFRFSADMAKMSFLQTCPIQTLILDTTYCKPQFDFPKQEAVIQFVIEAIQAEAFNPKTLFLIGSYTIGKERLFLEVARVLRKKVYVTAAKMRLLECLGLPKEDMQWLTLNEQESHIHVVPMWTLASFKRLKHVSNQYSSRFSLIVAFSPTGWTFGKGKKKSPGRRCQQGTIIRYEVPYSEHSSFTELREFVKLISPVNIIPSVNNDGPESAKMMVTLLLSDSSTTGS